MFDIQYRGGNTIVITTKQATLIADPKQSVVGLKDINLKGAIELATELRLALNGSDARLCIEGPGEYEVADFSIRGIGAQRHIDTEGFGATIYRVEIGDVRIGILGNIADVLNDDQLEGLGLVDLLVIPVGGGGLTLDATAAAGLVRRINPKVVIPVHYADKALHYEVPQEDVGVFVAELGVPSEVVSKYKVKSSSSIPQNLTIVELTRE